MKIFRLSFITIAKILDNPNRIYLIDEKNDQYETWLIVKQKGGKSQQVTVWINKHSKIHRIATAFIRNSSDLTTFNKSIIWNDA